jgi:hypothetical protein
LHPLVRPGHHGWFDAKHASRVDVKKIPCSREDEMMLKVYFEKISIRLTVNGTRDQNN